MCGIKEAEQIRTAIGGTEQEISTRTVMKEKPGREAQAQT